MLTMPTLRSIRHRLDTMQAEDDREVGQASGPSSEAPNARTKLTLLTLPHELQKEIVKHVPSKSLKPLQLVSKHFHELASAELYAHLEFFFTHPDSAAFYTSLQYRPSFALNLYATCSHDYMQYVRSISFAMSEQDAEEVQKRVASKYHYQEEACRLLSTVLLLVLRKTCVLERFTWNVPIDIDAEVYSTLSKIPTLHTLSIRHDTSSISRMALNLHPPPPTHTVGNQHLVAPPSNAIFGTQQPPPMNPITKMQRTWLAQARNERKTLSHFGHLHDLSILGIDGMEVVRQAATCMRQCSIGIKSLSLTLSPHFAKRARRPAVSNSYVGHPVDDDDDDVTQPNTPSAPVPAPVPAVNEADIKKEQKAQDAILAVIFGFETMAPADRKFDRMLKDTAAKRTSTEDPHAAFLQGMKSALASLPKYKATHPANLQRSGFIENLDKAVKKYLEHDKKKPGKDKPAKTKAKEPKPSSSQPTLPPPTSWDEPPPPPVLLGKSKKAKKLPSNFPYMSSKSSNPKAGPAPDTFDTFDFNSFVQNGMPPLPKSPAAPGQPPSHSWAGGMPPNPSSSSFSFNPAPPSTMPFGVPMNQLYSTQPGQALTDSTGAGGAGWMYSNHVPKPTSSHGLPSSSNWWDYPPPGQPGSSSKPPPPLPSSMIYTPTPPPPPPPEEMPPPNVGAAETHGSHASHGYDTQSSDSGDDDDDAGMTDPGTKSTGSAPVEFQSQVGLEDMGVDLEHPDTESDDEADPQLESSGCRSRGDTSGDASPGLKPNGTAISDAGPVEAPTMNGAPVTNGKGKEPAGSAIVPASDLEPRTLPQPNGNAAAAEEPAKELSPQEQMRDYVRMKHGFSLDALALYLVPLKASVVARALELPALTRLTLLSVGPQGALWTLLERHAADFGPLGLRSVHTDDVSLALLACLQRLRGLAELYLVRRRAQDLDCTTTKTPASLHDIRTLALRRHAPTLVRLAVQNAEDDAWDLDARCFRLLAAKATRLEELAFNVEMTDFHTFVQCLPRMTALVAVNIVYLRSPDRLSSLGRECRKFLLDVCQFHPHLRLKYVAISGFVHEIGEVRRPGQPRSGAADTADAATGPSSGGDRHRRSTRSTAPPRREKTTSKGREKEAAPAGAGYWLPAPSATPEKGNDWGSWATNADAGGKGKGKAAVGSGGSFSGGLGGGGPSASARAAAAAAAARAEGSDAGDGDGDDEEGLSDIESAPQDVIFVRHLKFCEVPDIDIFTRQVRLGRV